MIYNIEECKKLADDLCVKQAFLFSCIEILQNDNVFRRISIKKKDNTDRIIIEPPEKIKTIQRKIVSYLKKFQNEKYCAYGFVKGKNNVQNATIHINKKNIYKIDIKDYFPSIRSGRIYKMLLSKPFSFNKTYATIITNLLCFDNYLYQGAPSSPFIANIITRKLDNALLKISKQYKCNYTRYADDMTFSTDLSIFPSDMFIEIKNIVEREMFTINDKKTKLVNSKMRQMVTGIVVNEKANLKRSYYRQLRQILYTWHKEGIKICSQKNNMCETKLNNYILGKIAYFKSVVGCDNNCYLRLCDLYNQAIQKPYFNVPIVYKLSNAKHLLNGGNLKAAGNSASDVLEEFLQILCLNNNITTVKINSKEVNINCATIDPLKAALAKNKVISSVQACEIDKLNQIRILCNHHKKDKKLTAQMIEDLINETQSLILEII